MSGASLHDYYLEERIKILDRKHIAWIIKDGLWMRPGTTSQRKLCDLLICYDPGTHNIPELHGVPEELKGSHGKRPYAIKQLLSGREWFETQAKLYVPFGRFTVYTQGEYETEVINYDRRMGKSHL